MVRSALAAFCLIATISAVCAQQITVKPYTGVVEGRFADVVKKQADIMRITIGMNFIVAGIADPVSDDSKLRERTRRNVYQIALRECELILQMIASECRIESININLNRHQLPQMPDSVNVNASIALRAVPK